MGTPKAPQSLPWTPPGASESLENELLDIENLHFSTPRLLKTQKNTKKHRYLPRTQNPLKLRQNQSILGTFGPILGKPAF